MNQYSAYSLISMLNGNDANNNRNNSLGSAYSYSVGQPPGLNFARNRTQLENQHGYNQQKVSFDNKDRNYNGHGWGVKTDPEENVDEINLDHSFTVLDHYNSDLNMNIDLDGYGGAALTEPDGFCFCWSGARSTYGVTRGKVFFEVHITDHLPVNFGDNHKETDPHVVRIGWSIDSCCFQLGESMESYGYGGTGKFSVNLNFSNYGERFGVGDVIGSLLDLQSHPPTISFTKNGRWFGNAKVLHGYPVGVKSKALFPHILSKNCRFKVNFGQTDPWFSPPPGFVYIDHVPLADRVRGLTGPSKKADCEMNMIVGLPGAGKTTFGVQKQKNFPDKRYNIIGTDTLIEKMRVMGLARKNNYHGRWEVLIQKSSKCLNKLFEIASRKRRNYILDQTNVYPSARKRKMKYFEGFFRRACVLIPEDDEFERRSLKRTVEDGKHVPVEAVLEMKANFTLPDEDDPLDSIEFVELPRASASVLVDGYRKEGIEKRPPKQLVFRHDTRKTHPSTSISSAYSSPSLAYSFPAQRKISDSSAAVFTAAVTAASVQPVAIDNPKGVKDEIGVVKIHTDVIDLATGTNCGKNLSQAIKQEPVEENVDNRNISCSGSEKTDVRDKHNNDKNIQQLSKHNPNSSSSQTQNYGSQGHDSQNKVSSNYEGKSDDGSRDTNTSRDRSRGRDRSCDEHSSGSKSRDRYRSRDRSRDRHGRNRSREKRSDRHRSRDGYRNTDSSRDRYHSRDRSRDRYRDAYRSRYRDKRRSRERSQKRDWSQNKYDREDQHSFSAEKQDSQCYNKTYTYRQDTDGKEAVPEGENQTLGMSYQSGSNLTPNTASLNKEQSYSLNSSNINEPFKETDKSNGNEFKELFGTCDVDYRVPSSSLASGNQAPSSLTNQTDVSADLSNSAVKQPSPFTNNSSISNPQQWQTSSANSSNPLSYDSAYQQLDSSTYGSQFTSTAPKNYVEPHQNREYCEPQNTDSRTSVQGSNYNTSFYNTEYSDARKMDYSSNVSSLSKDNNVAGFHYEYPTSADCHSQTPQQINQSLQQPSIVSNKSVYSGVTPDNVTYPAIKDSDLRFNQQDMNYLSFPPPSVSTTNTFTRNEVLPDKSAAPNSSSVPNLPPNNMGTMQDKMFDNAGTNVSQYGGLTSSNNWQTTYNANSGWNNRGSSSLLPSDMVAGNVPGKDSQASFPYNSKTDCPPPNLNTSQYLNFFTQMPQPGNMWQLPPPAQAPLQGLPAYMPGIENYLNAAQSFQGSHLPPTNPPRF